jgi:hypothetical protein
MKYRIQIKEAEKRNKQRKPIWRKEKSKKRVREKKNIVQIIVF